MAYAGFDPSSDSLHVGNLIVVLNLLRAHFYGIRPVLLIGGATAAIGDPSGRLSGWFKQKKNAKLIQRFRILQHENVSVTFTKHYCYFFKFSHLIEYAFR